MQWSFHEFINHYREKPYNKAFIDNGDYPNRFSFDGFPSTSKFLIQLSQLEIMLNVFRRSTIPQKRLIIIMITIYKDLVSWMMGKQDLALRNCPFLLDYSLIKIINRNSSLMIPNVMKLLQVLANYYSSTFK